MREITDFLALICVASMLSAACLAPEVLWAAPSDEPTKLEEIIVTGSKTGESNVQQTPIAISAFSEDQLQQSQISKVSDLMGYVPNLSISAVGSFAEIFMRGIGSTNVAGGNDPSTTVQVDGIYLGRPYSQFADFLDVQRVEVLRGPQGTLYGRNAVGGTINVISRAPTDDFAAESALTLGNYWLVQNQDYVSGALIRGVLDGSIAVDYIRHDPYLENIVPGSKDVFNANNGGVRIQLRYRPTSFIDATTRLDYSLADQLDNVYSKLLAPFDPVTNSILGNFHKVALGGYPNPPDAEVTRNSGIAEDINFTLNDELVLRSLTAYRKAATAVDVNSSGADMDLLPIRQEEHQRQLSQELNLIGNYTRFNFVTGLYYYHEVNHFLESPTIVPQNLNVYVAPTTTTDATAVYTQGTLHVTPKFDVTVGMRYTYEYKTFHQDETFYLNTTGMEVITPPPAAFVLPIPGNPYTYMMSSKYYAPTPKFGLQYSPTDDLMLYASATRGFKSGGFTFSSPTPAGASFSPEKVWSYEVGAKTEWFDRRLRANLTAFYYDYTDLQVQVYLGGANLSINNAATAHNKGIELEIAAAPLKGLALTANAAYLDARYSRYTDAPVPPPLGVGTVDATGNRLTQAPPWTINLSSQYTVPLPTGDSAFLRAEYNFIGTQFFEPTNDVHQMQKGYGLVNLSTGYETGDQKWQVAAWVRNIGDVQYLTAAFSGGVTWSGSPGAARTFGITVHRKW
jgi:iron complex outermembrane recepter protein